MFVFILHENQTIHNYYFTIINSYGIPFPFPFRNNISMQLFPLFPQFFFSSFHSHITDLVELFSLNHWLFYASIAVFLIVNF